MTRVGKIRCLQWAGCEGSKGTWLLICCLLIISYTRKTNLVILELIIFISNCSCIRNIVLNLILCMYFIKHVVYIWLSSKQWVPCWKQYYKYMINFLYDNYPVTINQLIFPPESAKATDACCDKSILIVSKLNAEDLPPSLLNYWEDQNIIPIFFTIYLLFKQNQVIAL